MDRQGMALRRKPLACRIACARDERWFAGYAPLRESCHPERSEGPRTLGGKVGHEDTPPVLPFHKPNAFFAPPEKPAVLFAAPGAPGVDFTPQDPSRPEPPRVLERRSSWAGDPGLDVEFWIPRPWVLKGRGNPHTPSPCQSFAFPASLLRGKRAQFFGQIHAQPLRTHATKTPKM